MNEPSQKPLRLNTTMNQKISGNYGAPLLPLPPAKYNTAMPDTDFLPDYLTDEQRAIITAGYEHAVITCLLYTSPSPRD